MMFMLFCIFIVNSISAVKQFLNGPQKVSAASKLITTTSLIIQFVRGHISFVHKSQRSNGEGQRSNKDALDSVTIQKYSAPFKHVEIDHLNDAKHKAQRFSRGLIDYLVPIVREFNNKEAMAEMMSFADDFKKTHPHASNKEIAERMYIHFMGYGHPKNYINIVVCIKQTINTITITPADSLLLLQTHIPS